MSLSCTSKSESVSKPSREVTVEVHRVDADAAEATLPPGLEVVRRGRWGFRRSVSEPAQTSTALLVQVMTDRAEVLTGWYDWPTGLAGTFESVADDSLCFPTRLDAEEFLLPMQATLAVADESSAVVWSRYNTPRAARVMDPGESAHQPVLTWRQRWPERPLETRPLQPLGRPAAVTAG
jgi:hypothetical protein